MRNIFKETCDLYQELISTNLNDFDGSQHPDEFRQCLYALANNLSTIESKQVSFLEVGAYKGLWAIAHYVICRHNNKIPQYATATWMNHNSENQSLYKVKNFYESQGFKFDIVDGDSTKKETILELIDQSGNEYNLVLIDADHAYKSVMKDIRNYGPMAKDILLFHDIKTPKCGVAKAIKKSKIKLNLEISYGNIMGIGIVFK